MHPNILNYLLFLLYMQISQHVEVWDDDPPAGGDDVINNFTVAKLGSLFDFDQPNSLTVNGTVGIGKITLAFHNLTTNPRTCSAEDNLIISSNSSLLAGLLCYILS